MSEFVNTIDLLGDDAVMDSIIDRTITEFNDNQITHIGDHAFNMCTALTSVDLPEVVTAGQYAFYGCRNLTTINLPKLTTTAVSMFCWSGVVNVCLPSLKKTVDQLFRDTKLYIVDLPVCESLDGWGPFYGTYGSLKGIVLRNNAVCTLPNPAHTFMVYVDGTTIFDSADDCYFYVPKALIEDYKIATNWTVYADRLRTLEDYTVDGTVTGEIALECRGIALDKTEMAFTTTQSQTLSAITTPAVFIGDSTVRWSCDNTKVARVTDGVVTPISDGTAIITATCGEYSASCSVTVSGLGQYRYTPIYSLPQPTTFNGTSDYIDTGIKLFDTSKDFTIICFATFDTLGNNETLMHCMLESSGYPGTSIDGNKSIRICYTGGQVSVGPITNVVSLGIRFVAGVIDAIMYMNTNGEVTTVPISGTPKYTSVTQNLLLGAYQTTTGTKGRYFSGTIRIFDVYDEAISNDDIIMLLSEE